MQTPKWTRTSWCVFRDLTIRQRKIDFASFETFSPYFQVTQLLESSEVGLELRKIGDRDRLQRYLAAPVLKSTKNLVISWRNRAGTAKKCKKKHEARAELLFCSLNLLCFRRSRCPSLSWFYKASFVYKTTHSFAQGLNRSFLLIPAN